MSRSEAGTGYPNPDLTPAPGRGDPWTVTDRDPGSPDVVRRRRGPDLRLVPVAAAVWAAVAVTVGVRNPWIAASCLVVAVVAVVVMYRAGPFRAGRSVAEEPRRVAVRTVAVTGLIAAAWAGRAAWLAARVDDHPLRAQGTTRMDEEVLLATAPKQLDGGTILLNVTVDDLGTMPLFVNERMVDHAAADTLLGLQPGTTLQVAASVDETDRVAMVPMRASARELPQAVAEPGGLSAVTAHLRAGLADAAESLPADTGTLVPGMVVGDISMQDPTTRVEFLATGLTHLTAVSGANLAIVTGSVLVLATALRAPRWVRIAAAAVCLVAFVLLVGPEPSVLRAAVMGAVGLVAVLSARRAHGYAALSAAVIVLLGVEPGLAVDYAFILSVVATAGIVALAPLISRRILQAWTDRRTRRRGEHDPPVRWQAMLVGLVSVSLAADVVTAPVIVHMTGVVSPTAVLANVLVGVAVPPVTVIGMLGALVAGVHTSAATVVLFGAAAPAWWILQVASVLSGVDVLHTPGGWFFAAVVVCTGGAVVVCVVSRRWRPSASAVIAVVALAAVWGWHRGMLTTGPYAEATGGDAGLSRSWAEDLDGVDWYLGARPGESGQDVPEVFTSDAASDHEVVVLEDETAVLLHEAAREAGHERPDLYVVTACGRSRGMPSRTPDGVPVAFPCRDGTVVLGQDGLHAEGR